jgi:hypothetical protein
MHLSVRSALAVVALAIACREGHVSTDDGLGTESGAASSGSGGTTGNSDSGTFVDSSSRGSDESTGNSPPAPFGNTYESGSRLAARVLDAGDDATRFVEWWDGELGSSCTFAEDGEGSMRCFPPGSSYFLDDSCTDPVEVVHTSAAIPDLVGRRSDAGCAGSIPTVAPFAVGGALEETTNVWRYSEFGTCDMAQLSAQERAFTLDPVELASFVRADLVLAEAGSALDVEVIVAEDGSRQLTRVIDRTLHEPCAIGRSEPIGPGVESRCIPVHLVNGTGAFGDDQCTHPVVLGCSPSTCSPPGFMTEYRSGACEPVDYRVWPIQGVADIVFSGRDCDPGPAPGGVCRDLTTGDAIDARSLPELRLSALGTGRVQALLLAADDESIVASHETFWDSMLERACSPQEFFDGTIVCEARSTSEWVGFADPECTQPLVASGPCDEQPLFALSDGDPWDATFSIIPSHAYRIDSLFDGAEVFFQTKNGCEPVNRTVDLWLVGDEVAPNEAFPVLLDRVD